MVQVAKQMKQQVITKQFGYRCDSAQPINCTKAAVISAVKYLEELGEGFSTLENIVRVTALSQSAVSQAVKRYFHDDEPEDNYIYRESLGIHPLRSDVRLYEYHLAPRGALWLQWAKQHGLEQHFIKPSTDIKEGGLSDAANN